MNPGKFLSDLVHLSNSILQASQSIEYNDCIFITIEFLRATQGVAIKSHTALGGKK